MTSPGSPCGSLVSGQARSGVPCRRRRSRSSRATLPCVSRAKFPSLVHRYYDPATGQFLSVDPDVAATGQPYVYTNDNPVNENDPSGLISAGTICGEDGSQSSQCKAAQQNSKQVAHQECTNDPAACGNSQQYYSFCLSVVVAEGCITFGGGGTYIQAGPGFGFPGVSASIGSVHGGNTQQLLQGWSYHVGGGFLAGAGWAQTLQCPSGEGARGPYATAGFPPLLGGGYYTDGWRIR